MNTIIALHCTVLFSSVDDIDRPDRLLAEELHDEPLVQVAGRHEDAAGAGGDLSVGGGGEVEV